MSKNKKNPSSPGYHLYIQDKRVQNSRQGRNEGRKAFEDLVEACTLIMSGNFLKQFNLDITKYIYSSSKIKDRR